MRQYYHIQGRHRGHNKPHGVLQNFSLTTSWILSVNKTAIAEKTGSSNRIFLESTESWYFFYFICFSVTLFFFPPQPFPLHLLFAVFPAILNGSWINKSYNYNSDPALKKIPSHLSLVLVTSACRGQMKSSGFTVWFCSSFTPSAVLQDYTKVRD